MGDNSMTGFSQRLKQIFMILGILIALFLLVLIMQAVGLVDGLMAVFHSMEALVFGLVFAFLLGKVCTRMEERFRKMFEKSGREKANNRARILSVALSMLILVGAAVFVIIMVVPQLADTIQKLVPAVGSLVNNFNDTMKNFMPDSEVWQTRIYPILEEIMTNLGAWVQKLFGVGSDLYQTITSGITSTLSVLLNLLIGIILSAYLLLDREKIFGKARKLLRAILGQTWGERVHGVLMEGVGIFASFFGSKVLEAVLIGVICFVVMFIMQLPFATLISILVGFANIIPFFGPIIGLIIGTVILLIIDPFTALAFAIMMIILIQFDGNFMGPKLLGNSTGLSPLAVIVAILFFGGCFGFWGALIGVPLFGWILYIVKQWTEHRLQKNGDPVDLNYYLLQDEEQRYKHTRRRGKKEEKKQSNE